MKKFILMLLIIMSANIQAEPTVSITGSNREVGFGLVKEFTGRCHVLAVPACFHLPNNHNTRFNTTLINTHHPRGK